MKLTARFCTGPGAVDGEEVRKLKCYGLQESMHVQSNLLASGDKTTFITESPSPALVKATTVAV